MPKNIFISNFKKIPRGFTIVLILIVITELFIYFNRADLVKDYWNKFLINEHRLIEASSDSPYLILGNSIQKTGIDPVLVDDQLLNLGLAGAKPMGHWLLLKRYLEKHKAPKVIFLYADPENQYDSFFVILRYFVNIKEFVEIWPELSWRERNVFFGQIFSTLDHRRVGLNRRVSYKGSNEEFVRQMIQHRGFLLSPFADQSISDNFFKTDKNDRRRLQTEVSISDKDRRYMDKLMQLADHNGIQIVYLGMVVPKELCGIFEWNGFFKSYFKYLDELKRKYPHAIFPKEPVMYLDNKYFGDMQHLNNEGYKKYTQYFKTTVFQPIKNNLRKDFQ